MKAITLRNIPPRLERVLQQKAEEDGTSMNRTIIHLLEANLGIGKRKRKMLHHELDVLAGSWSREEADELDKGLAEQRRIDHELWVK